MSSLRNLLCCAGIALGVLPAPAQTPETGGFGLAFDRFPLTLEQGRRTEILGPLYYDEERESQHTWAFPPLFSWTTDPSVELKEVDFLYPLMTYDCYGRQRRWQFCQILSLAGGPTQTDPDRRRFTLFPLYFQQRASNPAENYTAVVPFYGHLRHRLFRDEIYFVMFPVFGQSRKKDVVTDNYFYPIFHLRHGNGLQGWQVWPLLGHEHKTVTSLTNGFNDVTIVPGHDSWFAAWPIFYNERQGIGSDNAQWEHGMLPFYALERSPLRDSTTVIWPFFNKVDDREKHYREWDAPWPLVVFARGSGKTTSRVWPFFSQAHNATLESDFYLWPIYKYTRAHPEPLDRRRTRILFYLYSDIRETNSQAHATFRRTDLWPLFTWRRDTRGNTRLQVLAPLEVFVTGSHKIPRDWSPLWSLWRAERNPRTGASSQSLLWNLYRRDVTADTRTVSAAFGLYRSKTTPFGKETRLFFIPLGRRHEGAAP